MAKLFQSKTDISVNLNCYTIRLKERNTFDNFLEIKDVYHNLSFLEIVKKFVAELDVESYVNPTNDRIFYIEKTLSLSDTLYTAIIRKGHSGHETNIDEIQKKKATKISTIKVGQFSTIPFFLLLCQPTNNSKVIILITQSYKQFGFKEIFQEAFTTFSKKHFNFNDITCEFGTLSISKLFEEYVNKGSIRKLRFIQNMLPTNMENLVADEQDDNDPKSYSVELRITAKTKGFMGIKKNIRFENNSFMELYKIDGFEYQEVVADVSLAGRKRVLNISKPSDFSASYDLTKVAEVNPETNHPNFEKVNKEAIDILNNDLIPNIT
jgi:hypothetical protein